LILPKLENPLAVKELFGNDSKGGEK